MHRDNSADCDVQFTDEAVEENSTSEFGLFGQAILVSSRLGAYCGAAWRLLQDEGAQHADPDKASPLSHFCGALKLLIRQRIIHRVKVCCVCLGIVSLCPCYSVMSRLSIHVPWHVRLLIELLW
jgi:hypothetical protein